MDKQKVKIGFDIQERYVSGGMKVRTVHVEGEEYEDGTGDTVYNLIRTDTGENVYPALLNRPLELTGDIEYMAVSSYGGWGKGETAEIALKNMMQATGFTKASVKKFDVLRSIRVYSGVPKSLYVSGMGGVGGLMLKPIVDWMYYLNNVLTKKS
jgi:hypothetical protein